MSWFDPPDILRDLDGLDESLRFSEVLLSRQKRDTAEQWISVGLQGAPGFAPGWSNYSQPNDPYPPPPTGYYKTVDGWVEFRGNVQSVAGATATIFGLPAGYRPPNREVLMALYGTHQVTRNNALVVEGNPVRIDILPAGDVQVQPPTTGPFTDGLSLGGLRFRSYVP